MAQRLAVWWGSDLALKELKASVERNCACDPDHQVICDPHRMLADQNILNHLVFVKAVASAFIHGEHNCGGPGRS